MMDKSKPVIFDHIGDGSKGEELLDRELSEFVLGIGMSLLDERGYRIKASCRLVLSETPLLITDRGIIVLSYALFPESASLSTLERSEAIDIAKGLELEAFSFPISLYCIDTDGQKAVKGAGYVIKEGELERI